MKGVCMDSIVTITSDHLSHHPENPRKDLGDLEELTESIKYQGIMQNLTVCPAVYWDDPEEINDAVIADCINKLERGDDASIGFYVLIGNRRFEAGKAAGLTEFPCHIIKDITKQDQVSIMLTENMQRRDLTVIEQAEGMQQMLDFGDSAAEIAEKTGLAKSSVYHRLNLAKLDKEELKKAVDSQVTLTDLIELEKIEDIDKRNEILKKGNIRYEVSSYLQDKERSDRLKNCLKELNENYIIEEFPEGESPYGDGWKFITSINLDSKEPIPDLPKEELHYRKGWRCLDIYRRENEEEKKASDSRDLETKRRRENIDALKNLEQYLKDKISDYIEWFLKEGNIEKSKREQRFHAHWEYIMDHGVEIDRNAVVSKMAADLIEEFDGYYEDEEEAKEEALEKFSDQWQYKQALAFIKHDLDSDWKSIVSYNGEYNQKMQTKYLDLMAQIEPYGFTFEDEEVTDLLNGTHCYYTKKEAS